MRAQHGAVKIQEWLSDLIQLVEEGAEIRTSGGAEPDRDYGYLEFRRSDDRHSLLLFRIEEPEGEPTVRTYRFDGDAQSVRTRMHELVHSG